MKYQGRTTTAIVVNEEGKVLLVKRATPPFIGFWALPGGRVEKDETVEETIVREVKEETGLDVQILKKVGEYHEQGIQAGFEYNYYPACFLVKPIGGEAKRQVSEISEIKFSSFDKIPDTLAFEHSRMLRDYIHSRKQHSIGDN